MKKNLFLLVLLACTGFCHAYEKRDLLQKAGDIAMLQQSLLPKEKWVPYPAYSDRQGWNNLLGDMADALIKKGEQALNYEWKVVKATDYIEYERSGSRTVMEEPYNKNITTLTQLLMAELAEGKGRFTGQLVNGVFALCEMTSWSIAAHLPLQTTKSSFPNHKEHIIELVSGDVGALLSWTYYFFHKEFDKYNPLIATRLKEEISSRILNTYMNVSHLWWMAFNYKPGTLVNNWNPWCNSNVLQCFALMEDDPAKLAAAVHRTMVSTDQFINYVNSDGACEEGPSYWGHAAGKLYDYLQILYDITGGKISLFANPMIKNMGEYISRSYVGNDWVVNFADASAKLSPDANLIYRYGKAVKSEEMMQFAAYLKTSEKETGINSNTRDIFRLLQTIYYKDAAEGVSPLHNTPPYTWYAQTEFCYIKNNNGFFFAGKGGFNNESHNHNDAGTFNLYIDETPVIIDAGVGTYTRQTFSSERYTIWTMQSQYHNLPEINGFNQPYGAQYKASQTKFDEGRSIFSLNIAGAYPPQAGINFWKRSYHLAKDQLTVTDTYNIKNATAANRIHFLSWGEINPAVPGKITINAAGKKAELLYDSKIFIADTEPIPLDDKRLSNVWGNTIYRITLTAKKINNSGTYKYVIKR